MSIISYLFGSNPTMTLTWNDQDSLPTVAVLTDDDRRIDKLYLFSSTQPVGGSVDIIMPANTTKIEHNGIKAELIGQIELAYDRGNHCIFFSSQKELCGPGILSEDTSYKFEFSGDDNDKKYEGYDGINVRLRYFIRITITTSYSSISKEFDFAVQKIQEPPEVNNEIKMEVGIEDCLHIEFTYQKSTFHLDDVIIGKILFKMVRTKIEHIELQILRRESTGSGKNLYNETEVITKFEIMDGAPIKGENVPIRLFLQPYDLTPTFKSIHNKFCVKYYLNLVIVDEEEQRYFKQQEITLWRQLKSNIVPENKKENDIECKQNVFEDDQNHEIQNHLRLFGYNEDVIDDALKNVQNKYDINNLIEYINKKQTMFDIGDGGEHMAGANISDSDDKDPLFGAKVINKPVKQVDSHDLSESPLKQFHKGQEIYCRDLTNRKWCSARIKQTQDDGVLIQWNNPKWKASKYDVFIEPRNYNIRLKIKTKEWRYKDIDEWNCDELIEWIIEINLESKNEEIIIHTIVFNQICGADMNSLQDLNDILESFPNIDEITANKIYIQLLKVRLFEDEPLQQNEISNINHHCDDKTLPENVNKQKDINGPQQPLTSQQEQIVSTFIDMTTTEMSVAKAFLKATSWDIHIAMDTFFAVGGDVSKLLPTKNISDKKDGKEEKQAPNYGDIDIDVDMISAELQKQSEMNSKQKDENKISNINDNDDKSNDNFDENKQKNINGPIQQFYEFLKHHRLEQYFVKFKENECCDIRDIEYLIDDEDFLKNDIGIKHKIHRKRLIGECTKLKQQMDIFKETNLIPSILIEKLSDYGIVTMHILCKQVEKKMDLRNKLHIDNDNQITLLWNIIQIQIHSEVNDDFDNVVDQQEGVDNQIYNNVLDTAR